MIQSHYRWIQDHERQMDASLRSSLIQRLHILRYIPCLIHRSTLSLMNHVTRVPVLVQLHRELRISAQFENTLFSTQSPTDYFSSIHTFRMNLSLSKLEKLIRLPEVKRIYLDRKVYALLDTAIPTIQAPRAWSAGNQGEKSAIAVIDTGIHPHPDLMNPEPRIIAFKDFIKGKTKPYDDNGHGTHCAGDAAGNGFASAGKYKGPAPGAKLVGVKVLNKMGAGRLSHVIAGIEWCITHQKRHNIRVISLSLGSQTQASHQEDPVAQAAEEAWKRGITVVAAAGNDGPEAGTITSPGIHPRIITVGASVDKGTPLVSDDEVASFSSRGPTPDGINKPDILAPGAAITSLRARRSYLDKTVPDSRVNRYYTTLSGTSMATPIVAGTAAVLLTRYPDWTPDQVKEALLHSAKSLGLAPNIQGRGVVQTNPSWFKE